MLRLYWTLSIMKKEERQKLGKKRNCKEGKKKDKRKKEERMKERFTGITKVCEVSDVLKNVCQCHHRKQ